MGLSRSVGTQQWDRALLLHHSSQAIPHQESSPASHCKSLLYIRGRDTDLHCTLGSKRSSLPKPKGVTGPGAVTANSALGHAKLLARGSCKCGEGSNVCGILLQQCLISGYEGEAGGVCICTCFLQTGIVCPGQDGARRRWCRRASCHDRGRPYSQPAHVCKTRHHSKDPTKHVLC